MSRGGNRLNIILCILFSFAILFPCLLCFIMYLGTNVNINVNIALHAYLFILVYAFHIYLFIMF